MQCYGTRAGGKGGEGKRVKGLHRIFWAVMQMCPPETQGTLMYPLQLVTSAFMGMSTVAQLQAMEGIATTPKATPTVPETPEAPSGDKCWQHSSEQSLPTFQIPPAEEEEASKECPCKRLRPLKEGW